MQKPTLRNNQDGTCNSRSLGNGCFFQELDGSRCGCKCHTKPTFETTQCTFESEGWKEELQSEIMENYLFLAEMKQHAKDKTAHMIEMREQWDKLCGFISNLLNQQKKDLINQILAEAPEEIVMMCFCGELKDKYNCDGYCNCGAFIKNRRGYSGEEQCKMDGFNEANKQWKDNLTKLINSN